MMYLSGKTIFIVEDKRINIVIMKVMLEAAGATVLIDRWGTDTVNVMKSAGPIDLVIMDLMLPNGVTGYDVFEQMKAEPALKDIPTVVVSASDPSIEMIKARQKGFSGYLTKPINKDTFAKNLAAVIDGRQVWDDEYLFNR